MREACFPFDPIKALTLGFANTEKAILDIQKKTRDISGSCAIVILTVGDICYIANLGDSRAVLGVYNLLNK